MTHKQGAETKLPNMISVTKEAAAPFTLGTTSNQLENSAAIKFGDLVHQLQDFGRATYSESVAIHTVNEVQGVSKCGAQVNSAHLPQLVSDNDERRNNNFEKRSKKEMAGLELEHTKEKARLIQLRMKEHLDQTYCNLFACNGLTESRCPLTLSAFKTFCKQAPVQLVEGLYNVMLRLQQERSIHCKEAAYDYSCFKKEQRIIRKEVFTELFHLLYFGSSIDSVSLCFDILNSGDCSDFDDLLFMDGLRLALENAIIYLKGHAEQSHNYNQIGTEIGIHRLINSRVNPQSKQALNEKNKIESLLTEINDSNEISTVVQILLKDLDMRSNANFVKKAEFIRFGSTLSALIMRQLLLELPFSSHLILLSKQTLEHLMVPKSQQEDQVNHYIGGQEYKGDVCGKDLSAYGQLLCRIEGNKLNAPSKTEEIVVFAQNQLQYQQFDTNVKEEAKQSVIPSQNQQIFQSADGLLKYSINLDERQKLQEVSSITQNIISHKNPFAPKKQDATHKVLEENLMTNGLIYRKCKNYPTATGGVRQMLNEARQQISNKSFKQIMNQQQIIKLNTEGLKASYSNLRSKCKHHKLHKIKRIAKEVFLFL
ncbi:hypothetical protein FGO68_gene5975 [Halteria grandinella]|uniref:Uncharacterized protein n=1 Tax=Halteria grandinella TaxID=5974 RepID=A0A8J8P1L0_HALGN|nr:hypothetical protein FGO68_gene5975 [Halteria grandinella]